MANKVTSESDNAQQSFNSLKAQLGGLADSFRGQTADAFQMRYDEWETSARDLMESLDSLGRFLNNAAEQIDSLDSSLASQLR